MFPTRFQPVKGFHQQVNNNIPAHINAKNSPQFINFPLLNSIRRYSLNICQVLSLYVQSNFCSSVNLFKINLMRTLLLHLLQNWTGLSVQVELCQRSSEGLASYFKEQGFSEAGSVPWGWRYRKDHTFFWIQVLCFSISSVQISAIL